jgi:hypothetical protein
MQAPWQRAAARLRRFDYRGKVGKQFAMAKAMKSYSTQQARQRVAG